MNNSNSSEFNLMQTALSGHGVISLANENRFTSSTFSQPLTDFAVGFSDPLGIQDILNFVAPPVSTSSRRFEYSVLDVKESSPIDSDDARAEGSDFKRVDPPLRKEYSKTTNRGLMTTYENDGNPDQDKLYTLYLLARIYRNEFKRAIELLASTATVVNKKWDTSTDPDNNLLDMLISSESGTGIAPNRILFGQSAYRLRVRALRAQNHAGAASTVALSPRGLADFLGVDTVKVSGHRYQGGITVKERIVPSAVFAFCGTAVQTMDDASSLKRFYTRTELGTPFRVYRHERGKFIDLIVEHYSEIAVTAAAGIYKIEVS